MMSGMQTIRKQNLTELEVSLEHGIGLRQLRRMRLLGIGPRFIKISGELGKPGGRILYSVAAVEEWLKSRPTGGGAAAAGGRA